MKRGLRKVGWTWTVKHGWKRIPRSLRRVKKVPLPSKHKTRKKLMVSPAEPRAKKPKAAKAPEIPVEQGRVDYSAIPAPKADKPTYAEAPAGRPAPRQTRKAWAGKYADLAPPAPHEGEPLNQ